MSERRRVRFETTRCATTQSPRHVSPHAHSGSIVRVLCLVILGDGSRPGLAVVVIVPFVVAVALAGVAVVAQEAARVRQHLNRPRKQRTSAPSALAQRERERKREKRGTRHCKNSGAYRLDFVALVKRAAAVEPVLRTRVRTMNQCIHSASQGDLALNALHHRRRRELLLRTTHQHEARTTNHHEATPQPSERRHTRVQERLGNEPDPA